jgi:signal transduction histidine kinase
MSNKLLDLALLRNNVLKPGKMSLPELFDAASDKMRLKFSKKNIILETRCELSSITGDRVLLECLLDNLLDNAIKASEDGAVIQLSAWLENGEKTIQIRDFGKGITEEHIDKLTEPFYRVDKARSRSEGGAGLGLALCEQIAELHSAKLTFSSDIEKGTTAKITFTIS